MPPRRLIRLTPEQRQICHALLKNPLTPNRTKRRALLLLHADASEDDAPATDADIAAASGVDPRTVVRARAEFLNDGFENALCVVPPNRKPAKKLGPEHEALLFWLAATPPPPGYPRWTTRTLADHLNTHYDTPPVSRELVRRLLKKGGATNAEGP